MAGKYRLGRSSRERPVPERDSSSPEANAATGARSLPRNSGKRSSRRSRVRVAAAWLGALIGDPIEYHHLVPRDLHGDDVADNIVPLCRELSRAGHPAPLRLPKRPSRDSLSDAEYAYCIGKLGEGAMERLFGVSYER